MDMINLFWGFLLVALMSIGFFQFKRQKETVSEVEHSEVSPETDPVNVIHFNRYRLHGQGKFRRELNSELKSTYRSLNDKVQEWASKQVKS
jgi:hypothetical protein